MGIPGKGENMKRRLVSVILSFMIAFCMMPQMAFADVDDAGDVQASPEEISEAVDETASEPEEEIETETDEEHFTAHEDIDLSWFYEAQAEKNGSGKPESKGVLVLYKGSSVSSSETKATGIAQKGEVKVAKAFGKAMGSMTADGKDLAMSTLPDQKKILANALKSKVTIKDTYIFGKSLKAGSSKSQKAVISLVSSDILSDEELADKLSQDENIEIAEPNYICHSASVGSGSGDPYAKYAWQLDSMSCDVIDDSIPQDESDEVVVAIIDTGVDYTHEELQGSMWKNPGFKDLKGTYGYDFCYNDSDPMDENGHGTHCAGIIAAEMNNDKGSRGIASKANVKIMALRFLDETGSGVLADAIAAYCYAIRALDDGVRIRAINNSWGAPTTSDLYEKVIDMAGEKGALSFFASGNDSLDNDYNLSSPANAASPYSVSVNAVNERNEIASYSCYGRKNTDLGAQGTNIISTVSYNNYMPFLYDKELLGETTAYYGEFTDSTVIDGSKVTPSVGTDLNGQSNEGAVKAFGESVEKKALVAGSSAETSLSLAEPPCYNNDPDSRSLKWTIKNPSEGDTFLLYFPYEKEEGVNIISSYLNLNMRTETESDGPGIHLVGDVGYNSADENGNFTIDDLMFYGMDVEAAMFMGQTDKSYNDIWHGSGNYQRSGAAIKKLAGYGIGILYRATSNEDISFYIDSLAVAKKNADANSFGKYDIYSGTSMATPAAVGAAALLAAAYPDADALTLKAQLLASVTKTDALKDQCTTGGYIDFRNFDINSPGPAITDATVNFDKKTVTLTGHYFGKSKGSISYSRPLNDISGTVPSENIKWKDGKVTISKADDLIGADVTFTLSTSAGKATQTSFYLVKGEEKYNKVAYTDIPYFADDGDFIIFKDGDKKDAVEDGSENDVALADILRMSKYNACPVIGADRPLISANNGTIYSFGEPIPADDGSGDDYDDYAAEAGTTDMDTEDSKADGKEGSEEADLMYSSPITEGTDCYEAISKTDNYKEWTKIEKAVGGNTELKISPISNALYYGSIIYRVMMLSGGGRDITILTSFDPAADLGKEWKILYDSAKDETPKGVDIDSSRSYSSLTAMNGKLYLIGGFLKGEGEEKDKILKQVSSWNLNSTKPSWKKAASLPEEIAGGTALEQNGKIYYVMGYDKSGDFNRKVFVYDGKTWTTMNCQLPKPVRADSSVTASVGINKQGLVFSGLSTDGGGDTFVYKTAKKLKASKRIEQLNYTLKGKAIETMGFGSTFGQSAYFYYDEEDEEGFDSRTIINEVPLTSSGYSEVLLLQEGRGNGTVTGIGTYVRNDKAVIKVTPDKGSFIKYIKADGKKVSGKTTKAKTIRLTASKDNHKVEVYFGTYNIAKATAKLKKKSFAYTGKAIKPGFTLRLNGTKLKKGTDYTVSFKNNKAIGKGKIVIKGKGKYTGKKIVSFKIVPKAVKNLKVYSGYKQFKVRFSKVKGTKYIVSYRVKGLSRWKTKTLSSPYGTVNSLISGKTYQVKVAAFKKIRSKTYRSSWSKIKTVKVW